MRLGMIISSHNVYPVRRDETDKEGRPLLIEVLRARDVVKEIGGNSIFSTSSGRYLIKNKRPF